MAAAAAEWGAQASGASDSDSTDFSHNVDPSSDESGDTVQTEGEDELKEPVRGTSEAQTVFNIVKNIVGEGRLSLPAGVAAGTGLFVSLIVTTFFGALMGYTFSMMGRVCYATDGETHKECAEKSSGPVLAEVMAVTCALKTLGTCISYAIVISESGTRILDAFGAEGFFATRQVVLVVVMVGILLPLCLQRDLSILSYTSFFGVACEIFVVAFMQARLADGSYHEGGRFYESTLPRDLPYFGDPPRPHLWQISVSTVVLFASLSTAFIAHYNSPKFYSQMRQRSPRRFARVVAVAFFVAFLIYVWIMVVGYLTFGAHCEGLILNNYAVDDPFATTARVAIAFAVLFGFPLSFTALRDNTISTFGLPRQRRRVFLSVTVVLLAIVGVVGCLLHDLGFVNSFGGAIFGASITMVFSGLLCFFTAKLAKKGMIDKGRKLFKRGERSLSLAITAGGIVLVGFGSLVVILKYYAPQILHRG